MNQRPQFRRGDRVRNTMGAIGTVLAVHPTKAGLYLTILYEGCPRHVHRAAHLFTKVRK